MAPSTSKIRHFTIRETKASAEISLPGKVVRNTPAPLESSQSVLYEKYRRELAAEISVDGLTTVDDAEEILKRLLRLVQVASNPNLVDHSYEGNPRQILRAGLDCAYELTLMVLKP